MDYHHHSAAVEPDAPSANESTVLPLGVEMEKISSGDALSFVKAISLFIGSLLLIVDEEKFNITLNHVQSAPVLQHT